jgi:very-short-patch-repair endonuclease
MPILRQPVNREKAALARNLRKNMTVPEKILWEHLRANRLDGLHFRRQ